MRLHRRQKRQVEVEVVPLDRGAGGDRGNDRAALRAVAGIGGCLGAGGRGGGEHWAVEPSSTLPAPGWSAPGRTSGRLTTHRACGANTRAGTCALRSL